MELLALVQSLHIEAKLPGTPPSAVTGQTGRAADLVRWTIEAYNDIQRDRDGKWNWLRAEWTLDTVADTASYAPDVLPVKDVATDAAITRFRAWDLDTRSPPFIFLVSDGKATERELLIADWTYFRHLYVRGVHTAAPPCHVAADQADDLLLGPTPDGIYRLTGDYWRSNQVLAADDDVPEMPSDYHMLIVYRAIVKYAYSVVGHEILARAKGEGTPLLSALELNQGYSRRSFSTAGPLS